MQGADETRVREATETLQRIRGMQVKFQARWTRMDDLPPEDEQDLKNALYIAWLTWAKKHDITDAEVRGPAVTASKPDFVPYLGGALPG